MKEFKTIEDAITALFNTRREYEWQIGSQLTSILTKTLHETNSIDKALEEFKKVIPTLQLYTYKLERADIITAIFPDKDLFKIGEKYMSFFDIFNFSQADLDNLEKILISANLLFNFFPELYLHYAFHLQRDKIDNLLEYILSDNQEAPGCTMVITSNYPDFIAPVIYFYGRKQKPIKKQIQQYANAIEEFFKEKSSMTGSVVVNMDNKPTSESILLTKNTYQDLNKKYSSYFRKTVPISTYNNSNSSLNKKDSLELFDRLEGDAGARISILKKSDYYIFRTVIKKLLTTDQERLERLLVLFMNEEYGERRNRVAFNSFYRKLRDSLKNENYKFNYFLLTERLQSCILLEELN